MAYLSQAGAIVVALIVFFGLIVPGYGRYVLFGGGAMLVANFVLVGVVGDFVTQLMR